MLSEIIMKEIDGSGPISFCRFVELSLFHPKYGYYSSGKAEIGKKGDFYTAPSVHSSFGETLSRFAAAAAPLSGGKTFKIVEFGASGGHMAFDILQSLQRDHPGVYEKTCYVMSEVNTSAVSAAKRMLQPHKEKTEWVRDVRDLSEEGFSGVILANEFLDSLPFHRLRSDGVEIKEIFLSLDDDGRIEEVLRDPQSPDLQNFCSRYLDFSEKGREAEACLSAGKWLKRTTEALRRGFILSVDYGGLAPELYVPEKPTGTSRCFYRHEVSSDFYSAIGEKDITADVNFSELMRVGDAAGLSTVKYTTQGQFLVDWGILDILGRYDGPENQGDRLAAKTLFMPEFMGSKFKVLLQSKGFSSEEIEDFYTDGPFRITL